ncbi:NUDIX hydrolase, partial [Turicibacter sanguinis]|nr:NUDIX hydrolase [Turicibacter sanguinis]
MYKNQIKRYQPINEQEVQDQKVMLDYIEAFSHNLLTRENEFAHLTSSGFILNETLDKVLMIYHNLYQSWAWTGGHADGEADLLKVAIKEAKEETGVVNIRPLSEEIMALDILPVWGHMKKGQYVS